jgi:hypothetical protein
MQKRNILLIGALALAAPIKILLEKANCCVTTMDSTSDLRAVKVEQKALNTGIKEIVFVRTSYGKTDYIAKYLVNIPDLKIYWMDLEKNPDIEGVDKISDISKIIEEKKAPEAKPSEAIAA